MNCDRPLWSGLGCSLLETELYAAFNVHKQEYKPKSLSGGNWATSMKTELCLPDGREFGPIFPIAELLLSLQNTLMLFQEE